MSLIQCSCNCKYQHDGYCGLDSTAEITNSVNSKGCLHFVSSKSAFLSQPPNDYAKNSGSINKNKGSFG